MRTRKGGVEMKTKLLGLFVEPSLYERLRVRAFEERCSVSEVVRRSLADYLAKRSLGRMRKRGT